MKIMESLRKLFETLVSPQQFRERYRTISSEDIIIPNDDEVQLNVTPEALRAYKELVLLAIEPFNESYPKEFSLISLTLNPQFYYDLPDRETDTFCYESKLDLIFSLIDSAILYKTPMPKDLGNADDYEHECGLDKEFLLRYFSDKDDSIYQFINSLMTIPELQDSSEFIIEACKRLCSNPHDMLLNIFYKVSPRLLDDEEFMVDCLTNGVDNWGVPLGFASERIKKDKDIVLFLCSINGSMISQADRTFRDDRDVALIAMANAPRNYSNLSAKLQNDPIIKSLKEKVDKHFPGN